MLFSQERIFKIKASDVPENMTPASASEWHAPSLSSAMTCGICTTGEMSKSPDVDYRDGHIIRGMNTLPDSYHCSVP